jgi:hypothetical protein
MDLSNKEIRIVNTAISSYPAKTVVHCQVLSTLSSDIREVVGSYELVFEDVFNGPDDPSLISAVSEKISSL